MEWKRLRALLFVASMRGFRTQPDITRAPLGGRRTSWLRPSGRGRSPPPGCTCHTQDGSTEPGAGTPRPLCAWAFRPRWSSASFLRDGPGPCARSPGRLQHPSEELKKVLELGLSPPLLVTHHGYLHLGLYHFIKRMQLKSKTPRRGLSVFRKCFLFILSGLSARNNKYV